MGAHHLPWRMRLLSSQLYFFIIRDLKIFTNIIRKAFRVYGKQILVISANIIIYILFREVQKIVYGIYITRLIKNKCFCNCCFISLARCSCNYFFSIRFNSQCNGS